MTDGLWGLFGVIIGSFLTFFTQYIFELRREKKKNRKAFLRQDYQTSENIYKIKSALKAFHSFTEMDLKNYSDDDLGKELYNSINYFSKECSNIWFDFKNVLFTYFQKVLVDQNILLLDNAMIKIINANIGTKHMDFDVFRNIHEDLQKDKNCFQDAILIINLVENEFQKIRKYIIKKKV